MSHDGTCNNLANPLSGSKSTPYKRYLTAEYDDNIGSPRTKAKDGSLLPNPRLISTSIFDNDFKTEQLWTHFFTIFGIVF